MVYPKASLEAYPPDAHMAKNNPDPLSLIATEAKTQQKTGLSKVKQPVIPKTFSVPGSSKSDKKK